jgi:hypothetical protein
MRSTRLSTILWLLLTGIVYAGAGEPPLKVNARPGWHQAESDRVYTSSDLYGYIDGGAEVFLELGFERLLVRKFARGDDVVAVEVYTMKDTAAAMGAYFMKCGREQRDPSLEGRHTLGRYQLMFQQNRYYVLVHNESGAEAVVPEMVAYGRDLLRQLPPDAAVPALTSLPWAGRVSGSLRVIRGPFTLQAVYTLGPDDILQLGVSLTAVAADYRDAEGRVHTLIRATYPSAEAARAAFVHLRRNLDPELRVLSETKSRFTFLDWSDRFGQATLDGVRLDIRVNLADSPDKPQGVPSKSAKDMG